MKTTPDTLLQALRTWHRMPARALRERAQISGPTLMRAIQALGDQVVSRGKARRAAYAARRPLRGETAPLTLYRIDEKGRGVEAATLDLIYPTGCALAFKGEFEWPLAADMRDGWFDGVPYPLDDMRPQGFLGRNFARLYADVLQTPADPLDWSEDHAFWALSIFGADQPGNFILGAAAYRRFLAGMQDPPHFLADDQIPEAYSEQARAALNFGVGGSSAGGEFPKFTACRMLDGVPVHVIVKFSGDDKSAGTQRWADLLVCEHLALRTVAEHLAIDAAQSEIHQVAGRTFLEVQRFDRHGMFGRSGVCSWASINAALFGLTAKSWATGAVQMQKQGMIEAATVQGIQRLCHFGQLIANTDMHDGNLAFRPELTGLNRLTGLTSLTSLKLAPVYDMLPMHYAPIRGVELPPRQFTPQLPMPAEQDDWQKACAAAIAFWLLAADDARISSAFRKICAQNAKTLRSLMTIE